jgi:hypothetical protein
MTPLIVTSEVRLTDPDFHQILRGVTRCLDPRNIGGEDPKPVVIRFACEGSAYDVTLVPLAACIPARPEATFPIGNGAPMAGALYVVRDAWRKPVVHWLNGAFVLDEDVTSWDGWDAPWIDAAPFACLLSEVQIARGLASRTAWQRDYYRRVAEKAQGRMSDGGERGDWPARVLSWYEGVTE